MKAKTLIVGFFLLLLAAVAAITLFGDCIRQQFTASAETLAGTDTILPPASSPAIRKNLSSFGSDVPRTPSPARVYPPAPSRLAPPPPSETGQLTAGDWDDNLNYDFFLSFSQRFHAANPDYAALNLNGRTVISVRDEYGEPVGGARVAYWSLKGDSGVLFTPADGRVQLFSGLDHLSGRQFEILVTPPGREDTESVHVSIPSFGGEVPVVVRGAHGVRPSELDLAFVLDTTGSMGDELAYVKSELESISASVKRAFPDVKVHYGLVAYRDRGDAYVTHSVDFVELPSFREQLAPFVAGGGGDQPESMERAVGAMTELSWHRRSAKLAFLITDAPAHPEDAQEFLQRVNAARLRGIRIYSVAASGADDAAEFLLRSASQLTLGRYLFLTDDSGVGDSHAEPHIPCYQVQRLSAVMARAIRSELTGRREEPAREDVVRTVGNPVGGTCRTEVAARALSNRLQAQ